MAAVLITPQNGEIESPSDNQVRSALEQGGNGNGRIGSTWIIIRNDDDPKTFKKMWFYHHSPSELIAFFESSDDRNWYVTNGENARDVEFDAEDDGGAEWRLNERHLIPKESGIHHALQLLQEGEIDLSSKWSRFVP